MRLVVSRRASDKQAAARNTVGRFETEILPADDNRAGLAALSAAWVSTAMAHTKTQRLILDLDSSESPVHGQQEGAKYNGHYGSVCYHPPFCSNQFGDCEGAVLREGNVSSAEGWRELLDLIVKRYAKRGLRKQFRGDAGFARPEIYEYLEEHEFLYAIRIPANAVLERLIEPHLERPEALEPGHPVVTYHDFPYRAGTWDRPRRVVSKIEWHAGELFARVGFIMTNRTDPAKGVIRFHNGRGTCEQWIKEGKYAVEWMRLSCHQFKDNAVGLALFVLAYNLGNFLRRLVLPPDMARWSLTRLREKLVKIGARLTHHARRLILQMAEVAIPRDLFGQIPLASGCCRRYRREARTALPSSLKNPRSSPTWDYARACCPSVGQLQALQSAMRASKIGAMRLWRPGKKVLVAPTASPRVRWASAQPMKERHPFDMGNPGSQVFGPVDWVLTEGSKLVHEYLPQAFTTHCYVGK